MKNRAKGVSMSYSNEWDERLSNFMDDHGFFNDTFIKEQTTKEIVLSVVSSFETTEYYTTLINAGATRKEILNWITCMVRKRLGRN